jgi:hypothetical protein
MPAAKPFDANAEASKLYDLSKGADPKAFQHELDLLRQNPAHFNDTCKAMEAKESARENTYAHTETAKLHELKIVRSAPNGPVTGIYAQDVSKENDVEKPALPKVVLFDSSADAGQHGARKGEDPAIAARKAEQERQDAERREAARINTEAGTLLTDLQNHDNKGFSDEYNKLSAADKAAVGKRMGQLHMADRDQTLHIGYNPDGSIREVDRANKLEYITPADFLNDTFDKSKSGPLKEYCASLSPEDRQAFFAALQTEAKNHGLTVEIDDKNNAVVKTPSGKKQWDSKPESGFGKILHSGEGVVIRH